ncbi:MAG: hypothetical protein E7401_03165 [Ruminococcaceae bacterium]|nr:hypothetical protein [Oscillospiraceae bacterium]
MALVPKWLYENSEYRITFTGHSKGAGEAAVNAEFWNKPAVVFNPSVPAAAWDLQDEGYVRSYVMMGDILNYLIGEMPLGETLYLLNSDINGDISWADRVKYHDIGYIIGSFRKDE